MAYTLKQDEINKIKQSSLFKYTNSIWCNNRLNSKKSVGAVMDAARKFRESFIGDYIIDDWCIYYYKNVKKFSELKEVANQLMKITNSIKKEKVLDLDMSIKYVWIRVIYETFFGMQQELKVKNLLQDKYKNWNVRFSTAEEDVNYAVDIVIEGKFKKWGVQVKPKTFLSKSDKAIQTIKENLEKNKKAGYDIQYYFYDKDGKEKFKLYGRKYLEKVIENDNK